jgi:hypothetical protein
LPGSPTSAVSPSAESATARPKNDEPSPASSFCCFVHVEPART